MKKIFAVFAAALLLISVCTVTIVPVASVSHSHLVADDANPPLPH